MILSSYNRSVRSLHVFSSVCFFRVVGGLLCRVESGGEPFGRAWTPCSGGIEKTQYWIQKYKDVGLDDAHAGAVKMLSELLSLQLSSRLTEERPKLMSKNANPYNGFQEVVGSQVLGKGV